MEMRQKGLNLQNQARIHSYSFLLPSTLQKYFIINTTKICKIYFLGQSIAPQSFSCNKKQKVCILQAIIKGEIDVFRSSLLQSSERFPVAQQRQKEERKQINKS